MKIKYIKNVILLVKSKPGNDSNNNCDECKYNYTFISESSLTSKNCYKKCKFYYYINESKEYTCTTSNTCPLNYNILINQKHKCIDKCSKDDKYIYNYKNICFEKCPSNTKIDETKKECLEICKNNQIEIDNMCYNDLSNINNLSSLILLKYKINLTFCYYF